MPWKSHKLPMSSPVQQHGHEGGPVKPAPKTPHLSKASGGKGTQVHLPMQGPTKDLAGGGWVTGGNPGKKMKKGY